MNEVETGSAAAIARDPSAVPAGVIETITRMRRPIMISHVVPDADALGSMFAMARAWTEPNRQPIAALPDGSVSKRLAFMPEWAEIPIATDADFESADGFVVLDTAKAARCGVGKERKTGDWIAGRPVVNIDHHATNTGFGTVNWVVGKAGSTCELVYHMLASARRTIDAVTASMLFAGMQTDTLGFSLPSTSASALHVAGELVTLGAAVGELGERLCRSQRKSEFDLLRVIFANTRVVADGAIAYSTATHDEIHGAGCSAADIDDQINVPRSLEGARIAMLFTEGNRGKTRINFRGSGSVTVLELAAHFGGGGHQQSAGAILDCPPEEAVTRVVPFAIEYLARS